MPIIAVTAYDTYGIREAALEAGCQQYLLKPLEKGALERALRGALPGWRGCDELGGEVKSRSEKSGERGGARAGRDQDDEPKGAGRKILLAP
jgi:AmiR/NasT family two-component response regulator